MPDIPTELTVGLIINLLAVVLSVLAMYVPNFREMYAAWTTAQQALLQGIIITIVVVLAAILSFTGVWILITPDRAGVIALVVMWGTALVTNQTTYNQILTPPHSVMAVKLAKQIRQQQMLMAKFPTLFQVK